VIGRLASWRWFVATIVTGYLIGEQFPFSNWPMYATFGPTTTYVYIADAAGNALPHRATFDQSSAALKKRFGAEISAAASLAASKEQARRQAAIRLLTRLAAQLPAAQQVHLGGLRLVEVRIADVDRALVRSEHTVAELALPVAP
jgi:hypothetical protein